MKFTKLTAIAFAGALCLSVSACTNQNNEGEKPLNPVYYAMNTDAYLIVPNSVKEARVKEYNEMCREVASVIYSIDASLSPAYEDSYITRFNNAVAGATVELDKTAYEVLLLAKKVYEDTYGNYNPAVYYSVRAYKFDGTYEYPKKVEDLPKDEEISAYRELASHFGDLKLYPNNGKYYATKPSATVTVNGVTYSMKIDLGGIGKGYAVDKVMENMTESGFENGYFVFGGSSIGFKENVNGKAYPMGIGSPRNRSKILLQTDISRASLSTSGDYEQYYEIDGTRYCHVIDPKTGKPVQTGIMSATVIGGNAGEDDALTTALMVMGRDKAVEFINEKLSDRKVVFTYNDNGKYLIYTNMESGYEVKDEAFTVANKVVNGKIVIGE